MRQTGILAASAAYALTHNFPQLPRVHALTKRLEAGLEEIGASILSKAETCMVSHSLCNTQKRLLFFLIDDDRSFTTQPPLGLLTTRSQREVLRFQNPSSLAARA